MNVHPRKRYNNSGGSNNNYRRQNRHGSGGGHRSNSSSSGSGNFGTPRPRKNFRALQEKYLNMAKDAMSSGDRILAEYYLQHADHYYRQNEEFLEERNKYNEQRAPQRTEGSTQASEDRENDMQDDGDDDGDNDSDDRADDHLSTSGSALPDFLTRKAQVKEGGKVVPIQDWEE